MLIPFGVFSAAGTGGGAAAGSYDLISTTILGSSQASVTFDVTGLGSTYKHLQLRWTGRSTNASTDSAFVVRFNSDSTTTNYRSHFLYGTGSAVSSADNGGSDTGVYVYGSLPAANATANIFGAGITDILDPFSSSKNKTVRSLVGQVQSYNRIALSSGVWLSTSAVTSVAAYTNTGSWAAGSRLSLYGVK